LATIFKTFSLLNKNTNLTASDKKLKIALKCETSFDILLMFDKHKLDWEK
jgi:hypothetical protein